MARAEPADNKEFTPGLLMGAAAGKEGTTEPENGRPAVSVVDIWNVPETPIRHP